MTNSLMIQLGFLNTFKRSDGLNLVFGIMPDKPWSMQNYTTALLQSELQTHLCHIRLFFTPQDKGVYQETEGPLAQTGKLGHQESKVPLDPEVPPGNKATQGNQASQASPGSKGSRVRMASQVCYGTLN